MTIGLICVAAQLTSATFPGVPLPSSNLPIPSFLAQPEDQNQKPTLTTTGLFRSTERYFDFSLFNFAKLEIMNPQPRELLADVQLS